MEPTFGKCITCGEFVESTDKIQCDKCISLTGTIELLEIGKILFSNGRDLSPVEIKATRSYLKNKYSKVE